MATLTMHWEGEDSTAGLPLGVAKGYRLWKSDREGQLSFTPSFVRLSGEFYKEVTEHPVPLDLGALRALGGSPLSVAGQRRSVPRGSGYRQMEGSIPSR
jgi:hypothetical protein